MRLVLQRTSSASVTVDGTVVGEIGLGAVLLVGIEHDDTAQTVQHAVSRLGVLRFFPDERGRMNLSIGEVGGAFLVISQFTLAAGLERGRRPSFDHAAPADVAEPLVDLMVQGLRDAGHRVETGRFGATMQVTLVNDGPVTFVLDFGDRQSDQGS